MRQILFFIVFLSICFGFTTLENTKQESLITLENKIIISPNPAITSTKVFSNNPSKKIKTVQVFSMVQEKVLERSSNYPVQSIELRVDKLQSGKYFVKVFLSDGSEELATLIKSH